MLKFWPHFPSTVALRDTTHCILSSTWVRVLTHGTSSEHGSLKRNSRWRWTRSLRKRQTDSQQSTVQCKNPTLQWKWKNKKVRPYGTATPMHCWHFNGMGDSLWTKPLPNMTSILWSGEFSNSTTHQGLRTSICMFLSIVFFFCPKSSHFNRVFHFFNHPFWVFSPTPIFGNTHSFTFWVC